MTNRPFRIQHLLLIALAFCFIALGSAPACAPSHGAKDPAAAKSDAPREVVIAYTGAYTAWALLDELERVRLKAINDKGDPKLAAAELPKAEARNARLHRMRDALEIARGYIVGEKSLDECKVALRDAVTLLHAVVEELRADGVKVPDEVSSGLAAAGAFL
jgi:hypothetical protein